MFARWLLLACAALAVATPAAPAGAAAHDPIVFVHGYTGKASGWSTMISRFRADGWTAAETPAPRTYSSLLSNRNVADDVAAEVNRVLAATGATRVDLVTYSMGGLSTRYYLKYLGGAAKVDDWVSLAGPNHGARFATTCWTIPCLEMRPDSPFLRELNAGDETPGAVRYGTWRSPCDQVVTPTWSTILSGATNLQTACIGHGAFPFDANVYAQVREFVR